MQQREDSDRNEAATNAGQEQYQMTLEEAQKTIRDDTAGLVRWYVAAAVLSLDENSREADLLACLRRGGSVAARGAGALYERTGRTRKGMHFSKDHDDWAQYLSERSRGANP